MSSSVVKSDLKISYTYPLFALFNFIIGIIILLVSLKIDNLITVNSCTDKDLRNANVGIMLTSTILTCLSASYIGCFVRCKDCFAKNPKETSENKSVTGSPIFFNILSIVLGIVLIVFGSIIHGKSKNCKDVGTNSNYIWGLGLAITLSSFIILGISIFKDKSKKAKEASEAARRESEAARRESEESESEESEESEAPPPPPKTGGKNK